MDHVWHRGQKPFAFTLGHCGGMVRKGPLFEALRIDPGSPRALA